MRFSRNNIKITSMVTLVEVLLRPRPLWGLNRLVYGSLIYQLPVYETWMNSSLWFFNFKITFDGTVQMLDLFDIVFDGWSGGVCPLLLFLNGFQISGWSLVYLVIFGKYEGDSLPQFLYPVVVYTTPHPPLLWTSFQHRRRGHTNVWSGDVCVIPEQKKRTKWTGCLVFESLCV